MLTARAPHTTERSGAGYDRSSARDLIFLTLIVFLSAAPTLPASDSTATTGPSSACTTLHQSRPLPVTSTSSTGRKAMTAARMGSLSLLDHVHWFDRLIADAAATSFGDYGLRLPLLLGSVWHAGAAGTSFTAGLVTALVSCGYLAYTNRFETRPLPGLAACTASAVGWSRALRARPRNLRHQHDAQISAAGISNRVMIASALGVIVCFVAFAAALANAFVNRLRRPRVFCALVAFIAGAQCALLNGIAWHWVRAHEQAQEVLSSFPRQLPEVLPRPRSSATVSVPMWDRPSSSSRAGI